MARVLAVLRDRVLCAVRGHRWAAAAAWADVCERATCAAVRPARRGAVTTRRAA